MLPRYWPSVMCGEYDLSTAFMLIAYTSSGVIWNWGMNEPFSCIWYVGFTAALAAMQLKLKNLPRYFSEFVFNVPPMSNCGFPTSCVALPPEVAAVKAPATL